MGKHGKKQSHDHRRGRRTSYTVTEDEDEEIQGYPLSPTTSLQQVTLSDSDQESLERETETGEIPSNNDDAPSKFSLYQQSVQSPKGDISYLQKFFLMYVGGRVPLHLQEDFCGTALLSVEWIHGDPRRTAVGLDLDVEALNWCMENNVNRIGADICSRISLFHGNVLQSLDSKLINFDLDETIKNTRSKGNGSDSLICTKNFMSEERPEASQSMKETQLPARDIVCAFNYSCCCLHSRKELILYFKHALNALSKKGGIFVMDLYGGTSSENELRLKRRFPNFTHFLMLFELLENPGNVSFPLENFCVKSSFPLENFCVKSSFPLAFLSADEETIINELLKCGRGTELVGIYIWEQAEFDIIKRKTRISLHFHLQKQQKMLRHAFSYCWRLWSLPEVKDCLEEAGFRAVHVWIRNMPDCEQIRCMDGFSVGRDIKYEEATSFKQQDSWNAYIVGLA